MSSRVVDPNVRLLYFATFLFGMACGISIALTPLYLNERGYAETDACRAVILERWGPRALVSLAFAITTARIYPTVKYAMGHGKTCTRVVVGGVPMAMNRELVRRSA